MIFDSGWISAAAQETIRVYLDCGGHVTVINSDRPTDFCHEIEKIYPTHVSRCDDTDISSNLAAAPVLHIEEHCPHIRVRKSRTAEAELWLIHNRNTMDTDITVRETGNFTVFNADMQVSSVFSDDTFTLKIPGHDILMLIRTTV